jgi:hypothetical protein
MTVNAALPRTSFRVADDMPKGVPFANGLLLGGRLDGRVAASDVAVFAKATVRDSKPIFPAVFGRFRTPGAPAMQSFGVNCRRPVQHPADPLAEPWCRSRLRSPSALKACQEFQRSLVPAIRSLDD